MNYHLNITKVELQLLILNNTNVIFNNDIKLGVFVAEFKDYMLFIEDCNCTNTFYIGTKDGIQELYKGIRSLYQPFIFSFIEYKCILLKTPYLPYSSEIDHIKIKNICYHTQSESNLATLDHIYHLDKKKLKRHDFIIGNRKYSNVFNMQVVHTNRVYFK